MKTRNLVASLALLATLSACSGPAEPPEFAASAVNDPTGGPATSPRLAGGPDNQLILSWLQPGDDGVALRYSRYQHGSWSDAETASASEDMFVNWADLPSVVPLGDGHLAAHWMVMSGAFSHAYDIALSESHDNGETWSSPTTPHTDGTDTEHGFVSIYADDGGVGLIWLDGRKMVNEVTDDPVASGMTLQSGDQVVDELVCDCCQTDVAIASSGPVAVYRNRSVDEIRDIYITRLIDGRWQTGVPVATDNWEIRGCPVNGPSIAANGDTVAVAWFTAAVEPLVNVAISTDSGATFSSPIEIIRSETLGRVAVALLDDGDLAVSWLESANPSFSAVQIRRVHSDGSLGPVRLVANTASGLSVPQMLRHRADLVFAWTSSDDSGEHVETATVAMDSL